MYSMYRSHRRPRQAFRFRPFYFGFALSQMSRKLFCIYYLQLAQRESEVGTR